VIDFGFDRWNAQYLIDKSNDRWNGVLVEQNLRTLHAPTKLLSEIIADGKFHYERNRISYFSIYCLTI
ncbi:MAG: hypothetical protein RR398_07130, partial [Clostridia bacterium]